MTKLSLATLLAAGVFAIYSAPSFAAFVPTTPPPKTDPGCTVNCGGGGDTTEPGDPWFPPGGGDDDGDDGDNPGGDNPGGDNPGGGDDPGGDNPGGDNPGGDDPKDDGKPGDPEYPGLSKQAAAELRACLARLEGLPAISAGEINKFGQPNKVTLNPICEAKTLTEVQPVLVEGGNVAGLEGAIKGNDLMKSKLGQTAYKARDVVGIDFDGNGNAILFVHKRG
ncbi:MAG TPA: hypothetical protein VIN06_04570 [Devosia sp.]